MLEVFDKNRTRLAILENAKGIREQTKLNSIHTLRFSLPSVDPKNSYCNAFNQIRLDNGAIYRIMPITLQEDDTGYYQYECEHMIATLLDKVMFGFVSLGGLGYYTRQVIEYILNQQTDRVWVLDRCDFSRQFEYGFEQENLLGALFSVPTRFTEPYMWSFNTLTFPHKLSLIQLDLSTLPIHYIRKGYNQLNLKRQSDPKQICTRLYPLGSGEGVNQLGISSVNGGIPYLQSPQSYINKYGVVERVWVDRRYEDALSLKESGQAMLNELQEIYNEWETSFRGDCSVGDVVMLVEDKYKTYITEVTTEYEDYPDRIIKIANRPKDIASSIADLADRQRIEMTYSQGATQIYADSVADNADDKSPLDLRFYLPDSMVNVNAVRIKVRLSGFRAYSKASDGGGSYNTTTDAGGGTTNTSSEGGGTTTSSNEGGGWNSTSSSGGNWATTSGDIGDTTTTTKSSADYYSGSKSMEAVDLVGNTGLRDPGPETKGATWSGYSGGSDSQVTSSQVAVGTSNHTHYVSLKNHKHYLDLEHNHSVSLSIGAGKFNHYHLIGGHTHGVVIPLHKHSITLPSHTHGIDIPDHTHSLTIDSHSHSFELPDHSHELTIPEHNHDITPVIQTFGNPSSFTLLVNGRATQFVNSTDYEADITGFLVKDGKIPRDVWHVVSILPNGLARVEISYNVTGFIQSRGGTTV